MRVFLSVYPGFTLAIPMEAVASMMLYNQKTEKTIQHDQKSRCTFISLPWLFNMRDQAVPFGVILREGNSKENKVVLLTAEIKRDIEIPIEEFSPIPKALGALRFSSVFSGIKFSGNPILLLNIEQLLNVVQKDLLVINEKPNPPEPQPSPAGVEPEIRGSPLEQPVPAAPSEPSPPTPNKVIDERSEVAAVPCTDMTEQVRNRRTKPFIEEPPKSPAVASEASSLTFDKILEVCGVIEKPPIEEPLIAEPSIEEPPKSSAVPSEYSSLIFVEILELCELVEEPPISPAETSESSSLTLEEILELCEIIEEPSKSPEEPSEPSPQISDEFIEVCEDIEVCEVIEACEVIEVIEEPPIIPAETSEPPSLTLAPQPSPVGECSPLEEVVELCEIKD